MLSRTLELVKADTRDGVALVTLTNDAQRNAISNQMVDELTHLLDSIEQDVSIGAVVITGAGRAFCAGADLQHLVNAANGDDQATASVRDIYRAFTRVRSCSLPTIAAVNGPAVGAGLNLALACDIRIAGRSARFSTRFLRLGLHPGGGHTWMLRQLIGPQATSTMVLFGQDLDGQEAERAGLAWRCVEDDDLLDLATAIAARASDAPRELAIRTKESILEAADISEYETAVEYELTKQMWSATQPDFTERMTRLGVAPQRWN